MLKRKAKPAVDWSRRAFTLLLALIMAGTFLFVCPVSAQAGCKKGIYNNGLYGLTIDINSKPFTTFATYSYGDKAWKKDGCAWYASARVKQLTDKGKTIWSGYSWYNSAGANLGFTTGKTLSKSKRALLCQSNHVAVIEGIVPGGYLVSEGSYWCEYPSAYGGESPADYGCCMIHVMTADEILNKNGFLGFVYLPVPLMGAQYKLKVSATGGTVKGAGSYEKNKKVTLTATPLENYDFVGWSAPKGSFSSQTEPTTTFTMPDADVTVKADFKLKLGTLSASWTGSATPAKKDAKVTGKLTVDASTVLGLTVPHTVDDFMLCVSTDKTLLSNVTALTFVTGAMNNLYSQSFDTPSATVTDINGGKRYVYSFTASSLTGLKNIYGAALSLSPGTTYYYRWLCKFGNSTIALDPKSFTTSAAGAKWSKPELTSSGYLGAWVYYDVSKLSVPQVGIFVGKDRSAVDSATTAKTPSGVEKRKDTGNIDSAYDSSKGGTLVFYKQSGFTNTAFTPGVTYYYKFYSIDSDNDVVYSSIGAYTPSGTATKYTLTVAAGTGGTIAKGTSGSYASGNVIDLQAAPKPGYAFAGWTKTAGTLGSASSLQTSFTMPAKNATVTANFTPVEYALNVTASNSGGTAVTSSVKCRYGDQVTLTATPRESWQFVRWQSDNGGVFADECATTTSFTMPASDVHIYADFAMIDYGIDMNIDGNGAVNYPESAHFGENVTFTAVPSEGYYFSTWNAEGVAIDNSSDPILTLSMPALDLNISATFLRVNLYEARDEASTMYLPDALREIGEDAFANTTARFFVLPEGVTRIGSLAFPEGAMVFIHGAGSAEIADDAIDGQGTFVEMDSDFSDTFAEQMAHGTNIYCLNDGRQSGQWSDWSEWSSVPVEADEDTIVQTQTQYRSAPIAYSTGFTAWSAWSGWKTTRQSISNADLKQERTRTTYPYYFFQCSACGAHMPYSNQGCIKALGGCGKTNSQVTFSWNEGIWLPTTKAQCTAYNSAKVYAISNGKYYYYWPESPTSSRKEYSYRTRSTQQVANQGQWSSWGSEPIAASDTLAVETRLAYRYKTRH